jgi:SPP1 gp7 family putative phage head morphogenesis protein
MAIFDIFRNKPAAYLSIQPQKKKRLSEQVTNAPVDRVTMQMTNLRQAVEEATDVNNPSINNLILYYDNAMRDSHVRSQVTVSKNMVLAAPFALGKDGKDSEEALKLLRRPWFEKFVSFAIDAEFYGYSLIEFGEKKDGEFQDCKIFPRRHIKPKGRMVLANPGDITGFPYADKLNEFFLVEVGDVESLGTLELVCREVIWKNFARVDWSAASERFGMPFVFMKTRLDDDAEVQKRARMLSNMGTKGWAIGDLEDEIEFIETSKSDFYKIYAENAKYCDEQISKLINGQTGTSDEKAFVGSAEVHERILDNYTDARLRMLTNIINYELIPFLVFHGYPLDGMQFRFTELDPKEKKTTEEKKPEDPDFDQEDGDNGDNGNVRNVLTFPSFPQKKKAVNALNLQKKLFDYLKRIFAGSEELFDEDIWQHNFKKLEGAIAESFGVDFSTASRQDARLAFQLRENAGVYAAFKNHVEKNELVSLLTNEDGSLRTWAQFKKMATPITQKYNVNWLKTEYNQAAANATMAKKWEGFRENADIYPNLQYRAVMDRQTRAEHATWNGIILPINDPFWATHYPPNGWGCRCSVTQTDKAEKRPFGDMPAADPGFQNNPGITGKLFSDDNAYSTQLSDETKSALKTQINTKFPAE